MDRLLRDVMNTRTTQPIEHPDAEQLAAWAEGTIYGAAAEGIESHLADCERCQAVIAAFVATEPTPALAPVASVAPAPIESSPAAPHVVRRTPYVLWAGLAAASILVYFAWPKPPQVAAPEVSVARNEPLPSPTAAQVPVQTQVIGPAPKQVASVRSPAEVRPSPAAKLTEQLSKPAPQAGAAAPPPAAVAPPPPPVPPPIVHDSARALPPGAPPPTTTLTANAAAEANTVSFITPLPGGGVEFGPTDPVASVTLAPTRQGVAASRPNPLKAIRWRVLLSGLVEKTIDGGATWSRIVLDPALAITSGASPSNVVCWLVGKRGAVLRSTDGGTTFVRLKAPDSADLVSIDALDARTATVATSDGRRLTTTDGGQSWQRE